MEKIKLLVELEYDDVLFHQDEEEKQYFLDEIIFSPNLVLYDFGDIGDAIGDIKVLRIENV